MKFDAFETEQKFTNLRFDTSNGIHLSRSLFQNGFGIIAFPNFGFGREFEILDFAFAFLNHHSWTRGAGGGLFGVHAQFGSCTGGQTNHARR